MVSILKIHILVQPSCIPKFMLLSKRAQFDKKLFRVCLAKMKAFFVRYLYVCNRVNFNIQYYRVHCNAGAIALQTSTNVFGDACGRQIYQYAILVTCTSIKYAFSSKQEQRLLPNFCIGKSAVELRGAVKIYL